MFYTLTHPEDIHKIFLREEFGLWLSQRQYFDEINQIGISKGFLQKNQNANPSDYEYLYLECYLNHNDEGRKIEEKVRMLKIIDEKPKVHIKVLKENSTMIGFAIKFTQKNL